jgi:hypothetical protein
MNPTSAAGEGSSVMQRARAGEGYVVAATPHPFEFVGAPLCPLPQGARAREASAAHFGETNPMGVLAKRSQAFIWGRPRESKGPPVVMGPGSPLAFARVGRDDDCLPERSTNLRMYEIATGAISIVSD